MLLTGRLVARETGRTILGLGSMVLVGTTSLMLTPATWYSASQPLWAGLESWQPSGMHSLTGGQDDGRHSCWRPDRADRRLVLDGRPHGRSRRRPSISGSTAGGDAGWPRRSRWPRRSWPSRSAWPWPPVRSIARSAFTAARSDEALHPLQGLLHTGQSIPENLVFGNLGLTVLTTQSQGAVLTLALFVLWSSRWWRWRLRSTKSVDGADELWIHAPAPSSIQPARMRPAPR